MGRPRPAVPRPVRGLALGALALGVLALGVLGCGETVLSYQTPSTSAHDDGSVPGDLGLDLGSDVGAPASFLAVADLGPGWRCSPYLQDCPDGDKCMPRASSTGHWHINHCVPVAPDPGPPGDKCYVIGGAGFGVDDCDVGSMCWNVDPVTGVGRCTPLCRGDIAGPFCEDPDTGCVRYEPGVLELCLPRCDPLAPSCPEGQGCQPSARTWSCDRAGQGQVGDPCGPGDACRADLVCSLGAPGCVLGRCCAELCLVGDPQACLGQGHVECTSWYEPDDAPVGYERVGVCVRAGAQPS